MALNKSIVDIITDENGVAKNEFLLMKPEEWATQQMLYRYSTALSESDKERDFPHLCWDHLKDEYDIIRQWFTEDGRLHMTLQNASIINRLSGPIGDGMGWDFKASGEPEIRMVFFKTQLMAAARSAAMIPFKNRDDGNQQFAAITKTIHSAYSLRAEIHRWRGVDDGGRYYTPADISHRWVAMQTYNFILGLGVPRPARHWNPSRCRSVFGPFDETTDLI